MLYIGFPNKNRSAPYFVREAKCKDQNLFLAIWAKSRNAHNRNNELDLNTLYCKQSYHYQTHEVTVLDGADSSIVKANPLGERTNFILEVKIINIAIFEGNVAAAATAFDVNLHYFSTNTPNSRLRLKDWELDSPTGQISYVIGFSPGKKFNDFKDPMIFSNGLESMHKLLFNNALETLLVPDSDGSEVMGKREVRSIGIVVVPLIAHILAGFLGLVVVCLVAVFLISYNRQNNLASYQDTLGIKITLFAHSYRLLRHFNGSDECTAPHLFMESRKYKLATWGGKGGYQLDTIGGRDNQLVQSPVASCSVPHDGKLVGPIELSIWTTMAATFVNIALLALLTIVPYKSALPLNGGTL